MIIAKYYYSIYLLILILFAIPVLSRYSKGGTIYNSQREKEPLIKSLGFTTIIILFVGFRPNSPLFMDGPGYWNAIIDQRWVNVTLEEANYQFVTKWLMSKMAILGFSPRMGFIILASIYYGGAFFAMRKMFPYDTLLAMILFCGTFGTFGGAVNGIKNGCACSMLLCAIAYKDYWKSCLFFLIISFGFHHSMQLPLAAFLCCLVYKRTKIYYILWFVCLLIALLHITYFQTLLAGYTDDHGAEYLLSTGVTSTGNGIFRPDFVLYSVAPIALGYWIIFIRRIEVRKYQFVLNVYLVTNAIWLLCMYANYTNRIASLSWCLFPLLILQPLLNEKISNNQHVILCWFVAGQLVFTTLMCIIDS